MVRYKFSGLYRYNSEQDKNFYFKDEERGSAERQGQELHTPILSSKFSRRDRFQLCRSEKVVVNVEV